MSDEFGDGLAEAVAALVERIGPAEEGLAQLPWPELVAYEAGGANRAWHSLWWSALAFAVGVCLGALAVGAL